MLFKIGTMKFKALVPIGRISTETTLFISGETKPTYFF